MPNYHQYNENVFINCPFDESYKAIFNAIVFTVVDCGFYVRCALEHNDSAQNRLEKIIHIIEECKYGIHDISRTELDKLSQLPRFNMPLELGIFLGARHFGEPNLQKAKKCLILDRERYRFQQFISDIAGNDPVSHENSIEIVIIKVRDWLRNISRKNTIIGGDIILKHYTCFEAELPFIAKQTGINPSNIPYIDYYWFVTEWLKINT